MSLEPVVAAPIVMEEYVRSLGCRNTQIKNMDELRLIRGLLRCNIGCGLWNRDCNGSTNIYKIVKNAINKLECLSYLSREISRQALTPFKSVMGITLKEYNGRRSFYSFKGVNLVAINKLYKGTKSPYFELV